MSGRIAMAKYGYAGIIDDVDSTAGAILGFSEDFLGSSTGKNVKNYMVYFLIHSIAKHDQTTLY